MLYDLNIAWSPATSQDRLLQTLSLAASLGYDSVALNHTLELPLPGNPTSPFPELPPPSSTLRLPNVLRRATFALADPAASNYRLQNLSSVYDILAIRPLTEKAFQNACITLDIPLISLDMTQHFPFHFRPKPCMAAVSRGVRFEMCYSQALAADQRGRANFISNATSLVRATRGRGIILSSEAKSALGLRAPADVVNLSYIWGLPTEKALEGMRSIPRSVVKNEGLKRNGFRGVIDIVQVATRATAQGMDVERSDEGSSAPERAGNKKDKSQKRKNGDDTQPMSKRQAKKMKLAARSAPPPKEAA
ncbi:putative ribonuclease P protein subunit 3 [Escovopsis weberi]|uniref:Putative ribonuclease P protein subunit 3 n=1 Tax=Escovopsis weberi TaxID=150374 RepID=A0A0M9VXU8_ESCWE|nr:putative ribonuclease P protein subunit 3 [Escovopsis weberi]